MITLTSLRHFRGERVPRSRLLKFTSMGVDASLLQKYWTQERGSIFASAYIDLETNIEWLV